MCRCFFNGVIRTSSFSLLSYRMIMALSIHSDLARLLLSVLVLITTMGGYSILLKTARRGGGDVVRRRTQFVWARNALFFACVGAFGGIWATKIAGVALSLAALTAAILIVSKEFIANVLGWTMLMFARPYAVGDFIELAGLKGRVVDINVMVTTVAEIQDANQLTGRMTSIPNGLLLTQPVRNTSATGKFVVHLLRVAVFPLDMRAAQAVLLSVTRDVCQEWLKEANAHLATVERNELIDLPSSDPKVLIDLAQGKEPALIVRFVCAPNLRVKVEQEILNRFLERHPL